MAARSIPAASTNNTLTATGQIRSSSGLSLPQTGQHEGVTQSSPGEGPTHGGQPEPPTGHTETDTITEHSRNRYGTESGGMAEDLRRVIDTWGNLPMHIKNAIMSLVAGEGNR